MLKTNGTLPSKVIPENSSLQKPKDSANMQGASKMSVERKVYGGKLSRNYFRQM
jgi:hypothetical protein